jgi:hypothetical protein
MTSPDHLDTTPPLQDRATKSPWVPLWRIIEQIASAIGDSQEAEHYAKTRLYIRQAAADGGLRIRGRREIEVADQKRTIFSEIYTDIPSEYWQHSVINVLATGSAFANERHTDPEKTPYAWGAKGLYEPNCYTGLQLNSEDVSQLIENELPKFSDCVGLKPTFWGMSIDLLKTWKWLRQGLRSFRRKQVTLQFPKTTSIFSRLWRDPVWSKVIATGITAGIGASMGVWYFHSQKPPPPATTPTPAILAAPSAPDHQLPPPLSNQSHTPVVWHLDSQFLVVTGGGPSAVIDSVLLQGTSTKSVSIKEAYAVSGLTGHKQSLMADVEYIGEYPVNKIDIPPAAPIWLELLFRPPLSAEKFLEQWGQFRVTIIYSEGNSDILEFDENYVRQKIRGMIPGVLGPHVTPKSN